MECKSPGFCYISSSLWTQGSCLLEGGVVIEQNLLTRKLTVRLDKDPDAAPKVYTVDQVKLLKDGRVKLDKQELERLKNLE